MGLSGCLGTSYNVTMDLRTIGEFELIKRLAKKVSDRESQTSIFRPAVIGIGDDTAVFHSVERTQIFTTDTMVDGVHYQIGLSSWWDVGWKSLAVNLSDIAAMGGYPLYALVTLGLPAELQVRDVETLYDGLLDCSVEFGCSVVGGDIVLSPVSFITIAIIGATSGPVLARSMAHFGDQIAVTGNLGASSAGLILLRDPQALNTPEVKFLRSVHCSPQPRLLDGQILLANGVGCAMDISDGLIKDLGKICEASNVSARLWAESLPIDPVMRMMFPSECIEIALGGGEDYELVFTAPHAVIQGLQGKLPREVVVVGEITHGPSHDVTLVDRGGRPLHVDSTGWDHFQ